MGPYFRPILGVSPRDLLCSLVGEGDLVHHCDSGVPEASMLVRSVELYPYVQSAFEQKTQLVSRLSKTATGAMA